MKRIFDLIFNALDDLDVEEAEISPGTWSRAGQVYRVRFIVPVISKHSITAILTRNEDKYTAKAKLLKAINMAKPIDEYTKTQFEAVD